MPTLYVWFRDRTMHVLPTCPTLWRKKNREENKRLVSFWAVFLCCFFFCCEPLTSHVDIFVFLGFFCPQKLVVLAVCDLGRNGEFRYIYQCFGKAREISDVFSNPIANTMDLHFSRDTARMCVLALASLAAQVWIGEERFLSTNFSIPFSSSSLSLLCL